MCNYNHESRQFASRFQNSPIDVQQALGRRAFHPLQKAIRQGRVQPGRDLYDGQPLSSHSLAQNHYMSPQNFQRTLQRMDRASSHCQWCGNRLPDHFAQQHRRPHDHREHIQHHFHPDCWQARMFAIAIIFGHIHPDRLTLATTHTQPRLRKRWMIRETVEYVIKKSRVFHHSPYPKKRRW